MEQKIKELYTKVAEIPNNDQYRSEVIRWAVERERFIRRILRDILEPYYGKLEFKIKHNKYCYGDYDTNTLEIKVMIDENVFNSYPKEEFQRFGQFIVERLKDLYTDLVPKQVRCFCDSYNIEVEYGLVIKFVSLDKKSV